MAKNEVDETSGGRWGLTAFQTGVIYLLIAGAILVYVLYQIKVGRVLTKSGELPLPDGIPFLLIEIVASVVGIVRGIKLVKS